MSLALSIPIFADFVWGEGHERVIELFDKYKQTPEYRHVNTGMDLAGFQGIFWLEYFHRLLGRLIGAVFLMQVAGFTINLLTLLAIVLSVGLVVDDAIVVVENVERHLSEGKSPLEAALVGARELVGPIIAMTITLAAVYTPIGLQGGLTGSLFREFAFTLAGAVAISGVVALTLSPMMCRHLLRHETRHSWLHRRTEPFFQRLIADAHRELRLREAGHHVALVLLRVPRAPHRPAPSADWDGQ